MGGALRAHARSDDGALVAARGRAASALGITGRTSVRAVARWRRPSQYPSPRGVECGIERCAAARPACYWPGRTEASAIADCVNQARSGARARLQPLDRSSRRAPRSAPRVAQHVTEDRARCDSPTRKRAQRRAASPADCRLKRHGRDAHVPRPDERSPERCVREVRVGDRPPPGERRSAAPVRR